MSKLYSNPSVREAGEHLIKARITGIEVVLAEKAGMTQPQEFEALDALMTSDDFERPLVELLDELASLREYERLFRKPQSPRARAI